MRGLSSVERRGRWFVAGWSVTSIVGFAMSTACAPSHGREGEGAAVQLNGSGALKAEVGDDGAVRVHSDTSLARLAQGRIRPTGVGFEIEFRLSRWGDRGALQPAPNIESRRASEHRVDLARGADLTEWWMDGARGLEQGFKLTAPGAAVRSGELVLELVVRGDVQPLTVHTDREIAFVDARGDTILHYGELDVRDATGRQLPARLETHDRAIYIATNVRGAVYPVVVDPLVWVKNQKLVDAAGAPGDSFGQFLSVSSDTLVVGAPHADNGAGAVHVFGLSLSSWLYDRKLTASNAAAGDAFGSVAITTNTLLVGARSSDAAAADAGAVYVFDRSKSNIAERQILLPSTPVAGGGFGAALSIDGATAIVGESSGSGELQPTRGKAHVFTLSGSSWSELQELTAAERGPGDDSFGLSVALSVDTAIVGAPYDDGGTNSGGAAYVFVRSGSTWAEQQRLGSGFDPGDLAGFAVAVSGDTAAVGAPLDDDWCIDCGGVYVYVRSGSVWFEQQRIIGDFPQSQGHFGGSVALSGDTLVIGASGETGADYATEGGNAYVYSRVGTSWYKTQTLSPSDGTGQAWFGGPVAISGNDMFIGAYGDNGSQGAVYFFALQEPFPLGAACTDTGELCVSGLCVDGYCCDTACNGPCQTCKDTPGTCTTVTNSEDPDTCGTGASCNAVGECKNGPGSPCSVGGDCVSGFCIDNICCDTPCSDGCSQCASGSCGPVVAGRTSRDSSCAYLCNGISTGCPTACGSDDDCAEDHYCTGNTCEKRKPAGTPCAFPTPDCVSDHSCRECSNGFCVDGYCCISECSRSCDRCNGGDLGWPATSNGTCAADPAIGASCFAVSSDAGAGSTPRAPAPAGGCACSEVSAATQLAAPKWLIALFFGVTIRRRHSRGASRALCLRKSRERERIEMAKAQ